MQYYDIKYADTKKHMYKKSSIPKFKMIGTPTMSSNARNGLYSAWNWISSLILMFLKEIGLHIPLKLNVEKRILALIDNYWNKSIIRCVTFHCYFEKKKKSSKEKNITWGQLLINEKKNKPTNTYLLE